MRMRCAREVTNEHSCCHASNVRETERASERASERESTVQVTEYSKQRTTVGLNLLSLSRIKAHLCMLPTATLSPSPLSHTTKSQTDPLSHSYSHIRHRERDGLPVRPTHITVYLTGTPRAHGSRGTALPTARRGQRKVSTKYTYTP